MKTYAYYSTLKKPTWAPPAWLFGPVWAVLYVLIAISFGYALTLYMNDALPFLAFLPFILNIVFNVAFTPIQFGLKSNALAAIDVALVLATLVWALVVIVPIAPWIAYANVPYLLWVCFATVLQFTVTAMNAKVS